MSSSSTTTRSRLAKRTCPHCGAPVRLSVRHCERCGRNVSETHDTRIGKTLGGRFEVHERIGEGGMAVIYRATDSQSDQEVALKLLDPSRTRDAQAEARFTLEGERTSQIRHPSSVAVHDFGRFDDGTLYISMELLRGEPLGKILAEHGAMDPKRVLAIMRQIAGAVSEVHKHGLVHRDINPSNIIVVPARTEGGRERAVLIDYGIAIEASRGVTERDAAPDRLGTTLYASPEQIEGDPLDARSDVYSLGVVLFHMLAGRHPSQIAGPDDSAPSDEPISVTLEADELRSARIAAGIADTLEKVIVGAMIPDPRQRYADARRFLHELDRLAEPGPRRKSKDPSLQEIRALEKKREKQKVMALMGMLAGAALLVALGVLVRFL